MEYFTSENYYELSNLVASVMIDEIKANPKANICLASGSSPKLSYEIFTKRVLKENIDIKDVFFTKLDEWCGFEKNYEATCEKYLRDLILNPLGVNENKYISFKPDSNDYEREVETVKQKLQENPITLSVLGLGKNGHLGLNEPSNFLYPFAHISSLAEVTKMHDMVKDVEVSSGMTIGMNEILNSRKIILIVSGLNKQQVFDRFLLREIDTDLPATFLWLHQNVKVLIQSDQFTFKI